MLSSFRKRRKAASSFPLLKEEKEERGRDTKRGKEVEGKKKAFIVEREKQKLKTPKSNLIFYFPPRSAEDSGSLFLLPEPPVESERMRRKERSEGRGVEEVEVEGEEEAFLLLLLLLPPPPPKIVPRASKRERPLLPPPPPPPPPPPWPAASS